MRKIIKAKSVRENPRGAFAHINLNTDKEEDLTEIPVLDRAKARAIIDRRPFKSWEDVRRVPGFSERVLSDLKRTGAKIRHLKSRRKNTRFLL